MAKMLIHSNPTFFYNIEFLMIGTYLSDVGVIMFSKIYTFKFTV